MANISVKYLSIVTLTFIVAVTHFSVHAALDFGEACLEGEQDECNRRLGFVCRDSKCQCLDDSRMAYSSGACAVFTNANCSFEYQNGEVIYMWCLDPFAICSLYTDICECTDYDVALPSEENATGIDIRCLPVHEINLGQSVKCNTSDNLMCPSSTGLICLDGYCQCPSPKRQHLDWIDDNDYHRKCVTGPMIINACDLNSEPNNATCDPNSDCGSDEMCYCRSGYTASYSIPPRCLADYQQNCSLSERDRVRHMCNENAGLICSDGLCTCPHETFYDDEMKACVLAEWQPCNPYDYDTDPYPIACPRGMGCHPLVERGNRYISYCR